MAKFESAPAAHTYEPQPNSKPAPSPPPTADSRKSQLPPQVAEFVALANEGDPEALAKLRTLLDENPQNWQLLGDLANTAEKLLFQRVAGQDQLALESLRRKAAALREEISAPEDTPLVKLAVQRVIACWLQLQYLDAVEASSPQWTPTQATQWTRRQESAERRYQVALKSLGLARRMMTTGANRAPSAPTASAP
ncbi:MAG: hypothetical protein WD851_12160 [Pirellulales bacterium]